MKTYRDNGAIGACLDEYEKAIRELQEVIKDVSPALLIKIVDPVTKDKDCESIQSILSHVLRAGYNYAVVIRKSLGETLDYRSSFIYSAVDKYVVGLDTMFQYNVKLFEDHPDIQIEAKDPKDKILVTWGQLYDVEQLLEHAICHILRHRRQIERFLQREATVAF